ACVDTVAHCTSWAYRCDTDTGTQNVCKKTCGLCDPTPSSVDVSCEQVAPDGPDCVIWESSYCPNDLGCRTWASQCQRHDIREKCPKSCKTCVTTRFEGPFVNTWTDDQCNIVGFPLKGSLSECQSYCLATSGCNAFNFAPVSPCVLRDCQDPVPTPKGHQPPYQGYSLISEPSTTSHIIGSVASLLIVVVLIIAVTLYLKKRKNK
ncbi:unnamed protein product, partial [Meganyctiphanes norvegica]